MLHIAFSRHLSSQDSSAVTKFCRCRDGKRTETRGIIPVFPQMLLYVLTPLKGHLSNQESSCSNEDTFSCPTIERFHCRHT